MSERYRWAVARGLVPGAKGVSSYGKVTTSGAQTGVLWPGGAYAFPPAAGVQMTLASTSINDTAAGSGIQKIVLHYLDANLIERTEEVTLNGTTGVTTTATNIRFIQCMHAIQLGSGKAAAGDITASNGGQDYSFIATGELRCASSVRMVPKDKRYLVTQQTVGAGGATAGATVVVELASPSIFTYDLTTDSVFFPFASAVEQDGSVADDVAVPKMFTEGQAVGMIYRTIATALVVGHWHAIEEPATNTRDKWWD